jgi:hypothetical protein
MKDNACGKSREICNYLGQIVPPSLTTDKKPEGLIQYSAFSGDALSLVRPCETGLRLLARRIERALH